MRISQTIPHGFAMLLAGVLVGACAATPGVSATVPTAQAPSIPSVGPTPTSSVAIRLEGRVILGRGTYYLANADGSDERPLADPKTYCCQARISPDRTRILTMPGTDQTGAVRGGTLTLDGGKFELLPRSDPTLNLVPQAWSPDGTRIVFEGWSESDPSRTGVYTARASDGGNLVRLTKQPGLPHDMPLDYSPDGRQVVLYRAVRAEPDFPIDTGGSLWVVSVDGSGLHKLDTGAIRPWWQARWAPDGSKILFSTERLEATGALWTIKPDGSSLTKVFEDPNGGFAVGPVWSADGSQIMFSLDPSNDAFTHPDNKIYAINADGSGLTLVVGGPGFKGVSDWWR